MIVYGLAAGIAPVAEHHACILGHEIIVVVVAAEYTKHIAHLLYRGKHAAVGRLVAYVLPFCAKEEVLRIAVGG